MTDYQQAYEKKCHKNAPSGAARLESLFNKIAQHQPLGTLMLETSKCGLPAHTLIDNHSPQAKQLRHYFNQILKDWFDNDVPFRQLNLITGNVTSTNIIQNGLPEPTTLNSQQLKQNIIPYFNTQTKHVYIIENANVFIELMFRLPQAALICGNGNNRNPSIIELLQLLEKNGVALHYLGDLDTIGIKIAANTFVKLQQTSIDCFLQLQNINRVNRWVINGVHRDSKRTKHIQLAEPALQLQIDRIHSSGIYVEQEELLNDYCQLIEQQLATTT